MDPLQAGEKSELAARQTVTTQTAYLNTTTIGDSELVIIPRPFQIMSPEAITDAKLRSWSKTFKPKVRKCSDDGYI
jgi:hypothetical protein